MAVTSYNIPQAVAVTSSGGALSLGNTSVNQPNIATSNDQYATVGGKAGYHSRSINFGFSIPSDATVNGIEITSEFKAGAAGASTTLVQLAVVTNASNGQGNRIGTNYASGAAVGTTDTVWTFGGPTDLWGATLTPAIVNATTFAFDLGLAGNVQLLIDYLAMRVYYTEAGGGGSKLANMNVSTRTYGSVYSGTRLTTDLNVSPRDFI